MASLTTAANYVLLISQSIIIFFVWVIKRQELLEKSKNAEACHNSLSETIKTAEVQMWRSDWSQKLLHFLRQSKRAV